ncbi:MAG: hypothetical protein ACRD1K_20695 [Acidimicrobiales bacterium]
MASKVRILLKHGNDQLDLGDPVGLFQVGADFRPPPVSLEPNLSTGSAANRRGGASFVDAKAENRSWNFGVNVRGESEAEITAGIRRLNSFLRRATADRPVYLHYRSNNDIPFEPRWGSYGADRRYEIVFGRAATTLAYPTGVAPNQIMPECEVELEIKPYALGSVQKAAAAKGGILEDIQGAADGISRGTIIPNGLTNKMTNPVFVDAAAFDTGWTAALNILRERNDDPLFVLFGKVSVKLTSHAATTNTYTQSINVGNTNFHYLSCYIRLPDGGTPTSNDAGLYYGSPATTVFRSVGNGWWRMEASVTGVASATETGILVKADRTVYVDGFQIEESANYATPLIHGNLLGCAWTGAAGASTSTRTAGDFQVPLDLLNRDPLDRAQGTIRVVWRAQHQSANYAAGSYYFFHSPGAHFARYTRTANTFDFSDGFNTIVSSAQTFNYGDVLVLHFVWGPGSKKIYLNGAEIATGTVYETSPLTDWTIYVGSTGTVADHLLGTFMDFTTYGRSLTAAEALADYTNLRQEVENALRLAPIPYIWTKAASSIVANCLDATSSNHAVVAGVPGTAPAVTEVKLQPFTIWAGANDIWLSHLPMDYYGPPANSLFYDRSGTADASACGDAVQEITVSTSEVVTAPGAIAAFEYVAGKDVMMLVRLKDAGSGLSGKVRVERGSTIYESDFRSLAADTTYRLFFVGPIPLWSYAATVNEYGDFRLDNEVKLDLVLKRASGSAIVSVDFWMLMPRPLLRIVAALSTANGPRFKGNHVSSRLATDDSLVTIDRLIGDVIELVPDKLNLIQTIMGRDGQEVQVDNEQLQFNEILLTPRWELV